MNADSSPMGYAMANPPLTGVRVLDLSRVLAGPYATTLLADLGAEVIKVESISSPDPIRLSPPLINGVGNHFLNIARDKKSLALDLRSPEGKEIFLRLVALSDVVIDNYRPGVMASMGFSFEELKAVKKDIIVCSISGFGQDTKISQKPAYDVIIQALSGAMSVTGEKDQPPVRLGLPMGDLSGGLFGAIGILGALHAKNISGEAQFIDISMLDALTHLTLYYPVDFLNAGTIASPVGGRHEHIAPYGVVEVSDGYLVVAIFAGKFWRNFCKVINREDLITDERFVHAKDRLANKDVLYEIIESVLVTRTQSDWTTLFDQGDVPFAPILSPGQVATSDIARSRDMFPTVDHPIAGKVHVAGRAIKMPGVEQDAPVAAPQLGRDTRSILHGLLGMSYEEIEQLDSARTVFVDRESK